MKVLKKPSYPESAPLSVSAENYATTSLLPAARADALAIAGQLCTGKTPHPLPLTLAFATPTSGLSVSRFSYETGLALCHLLSAPTLLVDLGGTPGELSRLYTQTYGSDSIATHAPWVIVGRTTLALARIEDPALPLLHAISSERFVAFLEFARTRFSVILLDVGALPDSVVGVLTASHCDGGVLCLRPGKTTLAEVETARTLFTQTNSKIFGFVFDEIS